MTREKSLNVKKSSFETSSRLPALASAISQIHAIALDIDGRVLTSSKEVRTVKAYWLNDESDIQETAVENEQMVLDDL